MLIILLSLLAINGVLGIEYEYLKYRELNSVPKGAENSVDESHPGVELFVKWTEWSCCSACCCPQAVCKKFATSNNCNAVQSVRHRQGDLTIRRTKDTGNQELEQMFNVEHEVPLKKAMKINDASSKSQLDQSRVSLARKLKVSEETLTVFQIEDCADHAQKLDCWQLAQCLYNSTEILPEKAVALVEERDVCENATIMVLRDAYNILSLDPDKLYRLQVDKSIGDGNIIGAKFTVDGEDVLKLKHVKDCAHQPKRIFQHPNGEDLIVRFSAEQLSKNPKIIAVISYENPARVEIAVDLVLKTKEKSEKYVKSEGYFAVILISSLAVSTLILLGLSLFFLR